MGNPLFNVYNVIVLLYDKILHQQHVLFFNPTKKCRVPQKVWLSFPDES